MLTLMQACWVAVEVLEVECAFESWSRAQVATLPHRSCQPRRWLAVFSCEHLAIARRVTTRLFVASAQCCLKSTSCSSTPTLRPDDTQKQASISESAQDN